MELKRRLGVFLTFLGAGLMVLFLLSEAAQEPVFELFFWSLVALTLGITLIRRNSPPPQDDRGRFRWLRKLFSRRNKKRRG